MMNGATAGDRRCYLYFDLEFTGLHKNTTPISIGIVDGIGRSFYGEFTDYDANQINPWIIENVIKHLTHPADCNTGDHWTVCGDTARVMSFLQSWLSYYEKNNIVVQFCGDVPHFDFVLLLDMLVENALNLPSWISPCVVDLNQEIGYCLQHVNKPQNMTTEEYNRNFIPAHAAFDVSREGFMQSIGVSVKGEKHNSLYDAKVIRAIHQNIWCIEG